MGEWLVGGVRTHTTLTIKLTALHVYGPWCSKTITVVTSMIKDHDNEYNNDEKVQNSV